MKSCKACKERSSCKRICPELEKRLPKDGTGKDAHKEINMDTEEFLALVEKYSYAGWHFEEFASQRVKLDLSILSYKEKSALMFLASGMSMRAAARKLGIHLKSFQKRVNAGRAKLLARHSSHLIEGQIEVKRAKREGGGK